MEQKMGGGARLSQTSPIPRSSDGDNNKACTKFVPQIINHNNSTRTGLLKKSAISLEGEKAMLQYSTISLCTMLTEDKDAK